MKWLKEMIIDFWLNEFEHYQEKLQSLLQNLLRRKE